MGVTLVSVFPGRSDSDESGRSASPVSSSAYGSPVNGLPKSAPKVVRYDSVLSVESLGRSYHIEDGRSPTSVTVGFSKDITPVDRSQAQTREKIVPTTSNIRLAGIITHFTFHRTMKSIQFLIIIWVIIIKIVRSIVTNVIIVIYGTTQGLLLMNQYLSSVIVNVYNCNAFVQI